MRNFNQWLVWFKQEWKPNLAFVAGFLSTGIALKTIYREVEARKSDSVQHHKDYF